MTFGSVPPGLVDQLPFWLGYTIARMARWPMSIPAPDTCEAKIHGVWIFVSLEAAAIVYGRSVHRCPACHGRVVILGRTAASGITRAMRHQQPHRGCPLMPDTFAGRLSRHPKALT